MSQPFVYVLVTEREGSEPLHEAGATQSGYVVATGAPRSFHVVRRSKLAMTVATAHVRYS